MVKRLDIDKVLISNKGENNKTSQKSHTHEKKQNDPICQKGFDKTSHLKNYVKPVNEEKKKLKQKEVVHKEKGTLKRKHKESREVKG